MSPDTPTARADSSADLPPEAAFWKARYEEERLRLAKLLVAYKDLEAELRRVKPTLVTAVEPVKTMTPA